MLALPMIHHLIFPREPMGAFPRTSWGETIKVLGALTILLHVSLEFGGTLEGARATWVEADMSTVICGWGQGGIGCKQRRCSAGDVTVGIGCKLCALSCRSGTVGGECKRGSLDAIDGDITVGIECRLERLKSPSGRAVIVGSGCKQGSSGAIDGHVRRCSVRMDLVGKSRGKMAIRRATTEICEIGRKDVGWKMSIGTPVTRF